MRSRGRASESSPSSPSFSSQPPSPSSHPSNDVRELPFLFYPPRPNVSTEAFSPSLQKSSFSRRVRLIRPSLLPSLSLTLFRWLLHDRSEQSFTSSHYPSPGSIVSSSGRSRRRSHRRGGVAEAESPARRWTNWMAHTGLRHLTMPVIILVVGLVKWCVGLGGYSGEFRVETWSGGEGRG